jgi:hypothetical protein
MVPLERGKNPPGADFIKQFKYFMHEQTTVNNVACTSKVIQKGAQFQFS